ncbi:CPBP family intramembrane glutamic endopeptidase [Mucilaginibacter gilvus]|uniref:CPBP family intramembrane metalloprotease n=1 Tax=Mucilaginibacter gilvus TaxID=2305909 RepID=A0A3S4Y696_9SPHI|nr:CPBP family intramembrane glutamic endopeptidase [Mucilaginibacter gilvus]RWY48376.1 CPBP family intramembrane metalloprotease [Mucilaginibacter gilvus]
MVKAKLGNDRRFGKLIEEQNDIDFPYYNGQPVYLKTWKWIVAWLGTFVGFLVLSLIPTHNNIEMIPTRILFTVTPLAIFWYLTKPYWKAIFRKPVAKDYWYMVIFAILNIVITTIIAIIVQALGFHTADTPATNGLGHAHVAELVAFYVGTGIQLFGEELLVVIPFLAVMSILQLKFSVSRKKSILWAWLLSALWFGAIHLTTYNWNIIQCFVIIGGARIALTLAFIRTKNIWVSTGAHILNDWALFTAITLAQVLK